MGPRALLALLAAAALAGASTVPVEKDRTEEMVTRCIVEVLSNALSKPNAPPINPECKEILKKSDKNDRERSENNQPEVRHPKEPAEMEKHPPGSMEKEQRQAEEESKMYMEGGDEEKLAREEGESREEEAGRHTPAQDEALHAEIKKHYQEMGREEERNYHSQEESKEGKCCEDMEAAVLSKKSHSEGVSMDEFRGGSDQSPRGRWQLEEGMQSPHKQIREGEEGEEERSGKYHRESQERDFSRQQEREESEESEETEQEEQPYKPQGSHGKHRAGDSHEEKRGRGGERGEAAGGSHPGEANPWEQWKHRQKHQEEPEEKGGHAGRAEELREERPAEQGSEEHGHSWEQSQESREEENQRHHHSEESEEKWREERRHHEGSHHSEGRMYLTDENEDELDRRLSKERQHRAGGRSHLWNREEEGSQKASARERKGQARRHHSTEDSLEEEVVEKKHHSSDQVESEEEQRYAEREEYRGHLPAEKEKRTAASYRPFYPLLWWKSRHLDKRDSAGEQLLEGREEGRPALAEKSLFPDYDDDDEWWSEKQIQSALNHRRTEKRNPGKTSRYDVERQYNKMDQLAQLLNYRKKSAEFPELYSSGEDLKKRHGAGNDRRSLSQRPLTAEEEKELENLAAMDLELQSIAEKINSLRRG